MTRQARVDSAPRSRLYSQWLEKQGCALWAPSVCAPGCKALKLAGTTEFLCLPLCPLHEQAARSFGPIKHAIGEMWPLGEAILRFEAMRHWVRFCEEATEDDLRQVIAECRTTLQPLRPTAA